MQWEFLSCSWYRIIICHIPEPHVQITNHTIKYEHSPWSFRHFVLGTIAIFVYVGIEVGVPGNNEPFSWLTRTDFAGSAAEAGLVTGTYWFLMLIGRFFVGALSVLNIQVKLCLLSLPV